MGKGKCWPKRKCSFRNIAILLLLVAPGVSHLSAAASAAAQASPPLSQRSEAELLLLALKVGNVLVSDSLPAFPVGHDLLLPIGELSRLLSFSIDADVPAGSADGFFISEDRTFHLDATRRLALSAGRQERFDSSAVEVHQDDIYVATRLLSKLLPLDFSIDLYAALVTVHPREQLPMQIRAERQREAARSLSGRATVEPRFPLTGTPHLWWDVPFLDQTLEFQTIPADDGRRSEFRYTTVAAAGVLRVEGSLFLSGTSGNPFSDVRAALGRRDPDAGLLGELRATEFIGGEVLYRGVPLIALPYSGPGLMISNAPLDRQTRFDSHSFEGDLLPGWEVELYRNDALVGYQQAGIVGRYRFDGIPLLFGLNVFRLAFYGPQGQRREERYVFNVGESLAPKGKVYYRLSGNDPKSALPRGSMELDYGLTSTVTATGSVSRVELVDGVARDYGSLGLRGYWKRLFAHASLVEERDHGRAIEAGLQTRIGSVGLSFRHAVLTDFDSEVLRPIFGAIDNRDVLRLDGMLPLPKNLSVPLYVEAQRDALVGGRAAWQISGLASVFVAGTAFSNRVNWFWLEDRAGHRDPSSFGTLLFSKYLRRRAIRGEVQYRLEPQTRLSGYKIKYELPMRQTYIVGLGATRDLLNDDTHFQVTVDKNQGSFGLGLIADYLPGTGLALNLRLLTSLKREPRSGRALAEARMGANSGAVSAMVFFDTNGNGVRDPGEETIEDVGFFVNRSSARSRTNSDGIAFLDNLPPFQKTEVTIAESTLDDPLWIPQVRGYTIIPRSGRTTELEFPVVITGEVTGTAYTRAEEGAREASGVYLQLVGAHGEVVKETRTAYDGFFDLSGIPPGSYELRLQPKQGEQRHIRMVSKTITIGPEGTIVDGVDVFLEEAPAFSPAP